MGKTVARAIYSFSHCSHLQQKTEDINVFDNQLKWIYLYKLVEVKLNHIAQKLNKDYCINKYFKF